MKAEYICAGQPVTLIFRLRQSGGPYITVRRLSRSYRIVARTEMRSPATVPLRSERSRHGRMACVSGVLTLDIKS
jgi:hypothetical protein